MRIGIDAREICGKPTGVGRHLAGLLAAWSSDPAASPHTFVLYAPQAVDTPLRGAELRVVAGAGGTRWEQLALPAAARRDRLDVFFAPGYTAPLAWKIPTVVLVHDISFVAHPEWFRWKEGLRRRLITRRSSSRAQLVLTVSEHARREIMSHFGLSPDRVRCIYPGVASLAHTGAAAREPLVLFVGSVFNRRHVPDLIRAFAPIARRHAEARLAIVGDNRSYPREDLPAIVAAERLQTQVAIRPYVFEPELAELYGRARVFALLSEYEGFGHPPLEALGSGVPSVLFDTEVAHEVCGDAAHYVRIGDLAGITSALNSLLFDEAARARVLSAGPAVLARYSWARAGRETLAVLEAAARRD
jgi:glycosyltransferase involved in cell wall biosynthesis